MSFDYMPREEEDLSGSPLAQTIRETLARIDERTRNIDHRVDELGKDFHELKSNLILQYVSLTDFHALGDKVRLLERIVFSTIGLICLAVLSALLALVVQRAL